MADLLKKVKEKNGISYFGAVISAENMNELRQAADLVKTKLPNSAFLLGAITGDKVNLVGMATDEAVKAGVHMGKVISGAAKVCDGGGGGKPQVAQAGGKDISKVNEAIEEGIKLIESLLQ